MKKVIETVILVILLVGLFNPIFQTNKFNKQLTENYTNNYNRQSVNFQVERSYFKEQTEFGLTKKQQKQLTDKYGENNVEFTANNSSVLFMVPPTDNAIFYNGLTDSQDVNLVEGFTYVEGHAPEKPGDAVINEKILKQMGFKNLAEINNPQENQYKVEDNDYKFVGVYQETSVNKPDFYKNQYNENFNKAYYYKPLKDTEDVQDINEEAIDWNNSGWFDGNKIVWMDNPTPENGYREVVDYQKSVDNGATGLINPKTAKQVYGDVLYTGARITLSGKQTVDQVSNDITKIVPTAQIVNEENLKVEQNKSMILNILVLSVVVIGLIMLLKQPIKIK